MKAYKNLSRESNVLSYELGETYIHVVFREGTYRNYLYNYSMLGRSHVGHMKKLAGSGRGLGF